MTRTFKATPRRRSCQLRVHIRLRHARGSDGLYLQGRIRGYGAARLIPRRDYALSELKMNGIEAEKLLSPTESTISGRSFASYSTLNPKPQTLNPKLQTPNSKP